MPLIRLNNSRFEPGLWLPTCSPQTRHVQELPGRAVGLRRVKGDLPLIAYRFADEFSQITDR
jgi:hypothetical protein